MRRLIPAMLLMLVASVTLAEVGNPLERGIALTASRDFRSAIPLLRDAVHLSSQSPQNRALAWQATGICHLALRNDAAAADAFREALDLDSTLTEASYRLGVMHASGEGTYPNPRLAETLLLKAAESGHLGAQRALASLYATGDLRDPQLSHKWLIQAARAGDSEAQLRLGARYERGAGIILNKGEAFKWYLRAAEGGAPRAQYNVAEAFRSGQGVEQSAEQYRFWMEKAARAGYRDAGFRLGQIYAEGQEPESAAYWYWRAAHLGHQEASLALGVSYFRGDGVNLDHERALHWFEAAGNHPMALYYRGEIRENGLVGDANVTEAFQLYRSAAQKGAVNAIVKTGMMYMSGFGVEQDTDSGTRYMRTLGALSEPDALNTAAWMLATDENEKLRSGKLAATLIKLATKMGGEQSEYLDTQAAVHAEMGKWRQAVRTQKGALKSLTEERYRNEMEQRLASYQQEKPWRERAGGDEQAIDEEELKRRLGSDMVFTGTIARLRAAQGLLDRGLFVDSAPTHVMEIVVQQVTSGVLPLSQEEFLILFIADPVSYYPDANRSTVITDFPLTLVNFRLSEVAVGGWHHELNLSPIADR